MNDLDAWILVDAPEPEHVRAFLDALREPLPPAPEDKARHAKAFFEALDAELGYEPEPAPEPRADAALPWHVAAPVAPPPASVPWPSAPLPSAHLPSAPLPSAPLPPTPPAAPLPQVNRAPAALVTTAPLDLRAALPSPAAAAHVPPNAPARPRASVTQHSEVRRDLLPQTTTPLGDNSVSNAVASVLGNTGTTAPVPIPHLELNQYAWLRAQLEVHPEASAEILRQYHVPSEAARRALFEHWEKRFAGRPDERAAYNAHLASYTYSLRSPPGQRR